MPAANPQYRFGKWRIDPHHRTLWAEAVPVPLNGRAFDMLVLLVVHRDRVVSREEIVAHVWKGLVVGENNLTVQMSTLRRVLGTGDDGAQSIVTVPGQGYQFTGTVLDDEAPSPPSEPEMPAPELERRDWSSPEPRPLWRFLAARRIRTVAVCGLIAALLCIGGVTYIVHKPGLTAPRLSIAVLPFRNLSPDHTQDYLADALTDDLTTDLAHIPSAIVISRESTDAWKGQPTQLQRIGEVLGVRYLVEGSLRAEDGHFHVNAQLVDAATGSHLWAERFNSEQARESEVRDAIVRRLATALDFHLAQVESARSFRDRSSNPDALDLFFRARAQIDLDVSLASITRAQEMLEQALAQQPDFVDAAAELGTILLMKMEDMSEPDETKDYLRAHQVIAHALELSPQNTTALAARARELAGKNRWEDAAIMAKAVLAIEPSNIAASIVLARCARARGEIDNAASYMENVIRLNPNSFQNRRRFLILGFIRLEHVHADWK